MLQPDNSHLSKSILGEWRPPGEVVRLHLVIFLPNTKSTKKRYKENRIIVQRYFV